MNKKYYIKKPIDKEKKKKRQTKKKPIDTRAKIFTFLSKPGVGPFF